MISLGSIIAITSFSCLSTSLWYSLYSFVVKSYRYEPEYTSRLVAAFHAILAVIFSSICMVQGPNALKSPGGNNTTMQMLTITLSVGYFAYDLWWCMVHEPEDRVMLLHHIVSLTALTFILLYGKSGSEATAGLFSLEFTNPLLQLRWFLRTWGLQDKVVYTGVELLFMLLFLAMRLGYGTRLTMAVVLTAHVATPVKIVTLLLYGISIVFIGNIGLFVYRKYVSKTRTLACDYTCLQNCEHSAKYTESD